MSYIDTLIENCNVAKAARPSKVTEMDNLCDLDGIQKAIYIIEDEDGNPEETFLPFSRYKEKGTSLRKTQLTLKYNLCWLHHHWREKEN